MNGTGSNKPPPDNHPPGSSSQDNPPSRMDPPRRRVMSRIPAFEGYHVRPDGSMPAFDFNRRLYLRLDPQRINAADRLTSDEWFDRINAGRDAAHPPGRPAVGAYVDPDLPRRRDKSYHYHSPTPPPSPPPPPPPRADEQQKTSEPSGRNGPKDSTPGAGNTKDNDNANDDGTANDNGTAGRRRRPRTAAIVRFSAALLLDVLSSWAIACVAVKLVGGVAVGWLGGGRGTRGDVVVAGWQVVGIAFDYARNGRGGGVLFGATGRTVGVGVHCRDVWAVVWVGGWLMGLLMG